MQLITIAGVLLYFGLLYLRYRSQQRNQSQPRRASVGKLKLAKILGAAILAWMSIGYALQHLNASLDGTSPEPSFMERAITFLTK